MIKNLSFKICLPLLGILGGISVNAQCNEVSSFSENFDAYSCCAMGVVPTCWDSVLLNGASQIISSTSPASGTSQIYQNGYGTGKISIVVMPPISNINAGTHQLKVKMKANSAGYLEFGYIKDNIPETFVVLQGININNTSYNDAASQRTFTVPTTVPDGMRLAIRNPGTSFAGHYWDDVVWEPIPNLATNENDISFGVSIYPNPFNETLKISDIKDVKSITINDAVGRVVKTIEKPTAILELNDLQKGVYFVNLHFRNETVKSFKSIKN
ncbi:T9SS type A sorting domain-containing protein [Chryseobacterium sp. MMS23-Vi53]|uniref:T9SS type A sorting domain-containing protein n=1 Tax=Chryseobacterium sp. MMS23-Vi53 TaxID=3386644 RepID=UPI0039EAB0E4